MAERATPRVLFVGPDSEGSNGKSLRNAALRNGHECLTIPLWHPTSAMRAATKATGHQMNRAIARWNEHVVDVGLAWKPDVVFVFRGLFVLDETIDRLPGVSVHYHPDDSTNPVNRSPVFDRAEARYDLHVTTKSHNVTELRQRGARDVLYVRCAYDSAWHRPVTRDRPGYVLGFIGTRRPDRLSTIQRIADEWGRQFLISGDLWDRERRLRAAACVQPAQWGFPFSVTVARAPVQLGFLNSANRDQHTCRSYEVPAAAGLLIAERTEEHEEMLHEGREAFFFSDEAELVDRIRWIAPQPELVQKMGLAARARMLATDNTYEARWRQIIGAVRT